MKKPSQGFTLIELLLYTSLASIVLGAVASMFVLVIQIRAKSEVILTVEQQGAFAVEKISRIVRNADSITLPVAGASSTSSTLDVYDASDDPTLIYASSSQMYIQLGSSDPTAITSTEVEVSGFVVTNLSRADTPGTAQYVFTLSHVNGTGRQEFDYSKQFIVSASQR